MTRKKRYSREILSFFGVFVLGGVIQVLSFCPGCLDDAMMLRNNFMIAGFLWMIIWKGSEYSVDVLDHYFDWLDAPKTRLFASILSMLLIVVLGFWGVEVFLVDLILNGRSLPESIATLRIKDLVVPLMITFTINSFMHGRGFLLAWREKAVQYEKLKTEQINTQYNSLKNQVNPHFLFNSLNALSSLVYEDQDRAVEFIRKLSEVYRYVLETKDKEIVSVKEELEFLNSYLYLQKIRFGENLIFNNTIETAVLDNYVVPISLQMLMENAIKHNVISNSKSLHVKVYNDGDYLYLENNLQEKLHKDSTGIGLQNIKDRYTLLSDKPVLISNKNNIFKVAVPIIKSI